MTGKPDRSLREVAACLRAQLEEVPAEYREYRFPVTEKSRSELARIANVSPRKVASTTANPWEDALNLRELLRPMLAETPPRYDLARWIVTAWGGIDRKGNGNKKRTEVFDRLIETSEEWSKSYLEGKVSAVELDRVASWSKYLAFRHPEQFAVYDSRVAYSLNWLLFKCKRTKNFFPFLPTENALLSALSYEFALVCWATSPKAVSESLRREVKAIAGGKKKARLMAPLRKQVFIEDSFAYGEYCRLAKEVGKEMYGSDPWGLTRVEMTLFAVAPFVATKIFDELCRDRPVTLG